MKKQTRQTNEIEYQIHIIRGKRVMLDRDLAQLYGVPTKRLNEQVRRNIDRFPEDFMFQLTLEEETFLRSHFAALEEESLENKPNLKSQFATSSLEHGLNKPNLIFQNGISSSKHGGKRRPSYAFTEQGVAMLSSVLKSKQAIQVNIQIMRTFTKIREMLVSNKELREKIEGLEKKYDEQFNVVFGAIKQLLDPPEEPKPRIGFRTD